MREDTIAAIATPAAGTGGIGVLRISGDASEEICRRLFRPRKDVPFFETHRLYHGDIIDPDTGDAIDEALVALMRKPGSYTGEDVLEISCHGNPLILEKVLSVVLKSGARIAEPGEFTKRAFLNNRMDLAQAESVAELIAAGTEAGLKHALCNLKGGLSGKIASISASLLEVLAVLEASIDFTEEDIELPSMDRYAEDLDSAAASVKDLLSGYDRGLIYGKGVTAVIAGRPNVGKSSLLNCLLGKRRAIVASQPGTTRDFIEADIKIGNLPVCFVDTAGIRESDHEVEREGVQKARQRADDADTVIAVLDGSENLTDEDIKIIEDIRERHVIIAVNKRDLPQSLSIEEMNRLFPGKDIFSISAKENIGIEALKDHIGAFHANLAGYGQPDVVLTNLRHKEALEKALLLIERAKKCLLEGVSPELTAFELGEALRNLSLITGEGAGDYVLEIIFSRFCVGK
ncbi:MAG: tRNA uridine-5-carboxymethylaminomethyl(34) synthesis GTPase MnmE [Syntrophales bacterium]|nr:tRNA uridine-5-carboxymethylaminomethyl(34) synthesis GTPase MnmE [Syntrophales bacterium]